MAVLAVQCPHGLPTAFQAQVRLRTAGRRAAPEAPPAAYGAKATDFTRSQAAKVQAHEVCHVAPEQQPPHDHGAQERGQALRL